MMSVKLFTVYYDNAVFLIKQNYQENHKHVYQTPYMLDYINSEWPWDADGKHSLSS